MSELLTDVGLSGDYHRGENSAVPAGNTVVLVTFAAPAGWRFYGLIGWGETDAFFWVEYDGVRQFPRQRISIVEKNAAMTLLAPDPAAGGTTVTLVVKNLSPDVAAFEGALLGV